LNIPGSRLGQVEEKKKTTPKDGQHYALLPYFYLGLTRSQWRVN
jgi:hypothetical protein